MAEIRQKEDIKKTIRQEQDSIEADGPLTNLNTMKKLFTQRCKSTLFFQTIEMNFFLSNTNNCFPNIIFFRNV